MASPADGAAPAASVAAILRPALLLWFATQGIAGVAAQVQMFTWERFGPGVGLATSEVGSLLAWTLVFWFVHGDREARRIWARPGPRVAELCIVLIVVTSLVLVMWERAMVSIWPAPTWLAMQHEAGWPLGLVLASTGLLAPFFEEWMFRGLLLDRFRRVLPVGFAIALQAMLFAAWHFDAYMVLPHFVFGVVAGVMRAAAGAVWPCLLMHCAWNSAIVLANYELL